MLERFVTFTRHILARIYNVRALCVGTNVQNLSAVIH